jgi:hypothetical protein
MRSSNKRLLAIFKQCFGESAHAGALFSVVRRQRSEGRDRGADAEDDHDTQNASRWRGH